MRYLFNACGNGKCFRFNAQNVERHYRGDSGQPIQLQVDEIHGLLDQTFGNWQQDADNPNKYLVKSFGRDGLDSNSQGRALGQFSALRQSDGGFKFFYDTYDFRMHESGALNISTKGRNAITWAAGRYVGAGREFNIIIHGTYYPPTLRGRTGNDQ